MKRHWEPDELVDHWTLLPDELALLANKAGATRLGFAALLKFFQLEGRFPQHTHEVPPVAVAYLAKQVQVATDEYLGYDWRGRTIKYHRAQVRDLLGVRETTVEDARHITMWLVSDVCPHESRGDHLRLAVIERCRALHLEPPTARRIDRIVRSAWHTWETQFFATIMHRLSPASQTALDALLADAPASEASEAAPAVTVLDLRASPGPVGVESVLAEVAKLQSIRAGGLPADLFQDVAPRVVQLYRQRAAAETPSALRAHPLPIRFTLLAALCWVRSEEITDTLVDLLIQIVHRIDTRAEHKVEQAFVRDLKRVSGKTTLLFQLAEAAVATPDGTVRDVIFPIASEQTLQELVKEYRTTGPAYRRHIHTVMRRSYRTHYRRALAALLDVLVFRSNNAVHRPVIRALDLLRQYADSKAIFYPPGLAVPIDGVIRSGWRDIIVEQDGAGAERVNRVNYEFCVLQALREKLRCKEIWVEGAQRYRNPDADLPHDFDVQRVAYYAALRQPPEADTFVAHLQQEMTDALHALHTGLPKNTGVAITERHGGWIKVSPLVPQAEPPNLVRLKSDLVQHWPMTNLLDVLKETDLLTEFTKHFTTSASREGLDRATLRKRLLLCLYGLGTNTGLKRISTGDGHTSYQDLRYVRRRFIHAEQLRAAIAHVVNAIFRARHPHIWGDGTTACASDSKKFGAWDQNLLTEWHLRYGGRGVMIYWHVERNATCIYSQLKACSSSEVAAMIEGVLRHCTNMAVDRQYVDSHGQSTIAFAFCHLLGFQLLPRLKDIYRQKLYLPHAGHAEHYPALRPVLTRPIDWACIRQQYDQIVKYATALRLGTADAEAILRRFTRTNVQHPTYRALMEVGKAVKTIFVCRYLHSEALRREIHEGLNVIETWNGVNNFIFYGKGSEFATNRVDDQEVSVLALHLLQNCLVYINTLMLQDVLAEPAWQGRLTADDLRALTPLIYAHINPYGTFRLDLTERLALRQVVQEAAS